IRMRLKYADGLPSIAGIARVSRPGQRIYAPATRIRRVKGGLGVSILSTSKGVMSGSEARGQKLGGEILGEVW
ncbi:MAG: 30S ribosomal protein S8, partial [Candidatus Pacearchaeota archaeon]|nr:30S ribosomal protein S8 [Candidatus Pacearchaeota archaeon]